MSADGTKQARVDNQNTAFWDELCGTQLANQLGITDSSAGSLKKFDEWYFDFYPYLDRHVPLDQMKGLKILEVGLGYGSVSQRLASVGGQYNGLDIAQGPVQMVKHRLELMGLHGRTKQGSILNAPYADNSFDWVVAIGCFHHTGNLQRAIDETYRILKPGGRATVMIYYAYSYRRWLFNPVQTINHLFTDKLGLGKSSMPSARERARYDASSVDGSGAPETAFTSIGELRRIARKFKSHEFILENIAKEHVFRFVSRVLACSYLGPTMGLDLYCKLEK